MALYTYSSEDFDSIELLERASVDAGYKVEYQQFDTGVLKAKSILSEYDHVNFIHESMNRSVGIIGSTPSKAITLCVPRYANRMRINGKTLNNDNLIVTHPNAEFRITAREKQELITAHISESYFKKQVNILFPYIDEIKSNTLDVLKVESKNIEKLKQLIISYFHASSGFSTKQTIDHFFVTSLKTIFSNIEKYETVKYSENKTRIVKNSTTYIEERLSEDITISDICSYCCTSLSTLERAFKEEFGMSPKKYITNQRLNKFRRKMKDKKYSDYTIAAIAEEVGIRHFGRLNLNYKDQFGISLKSDR